MNQTASVGHNIMVLASNTLGKSRYKFWQKVALHSRLGPLVSSEASAIKWSHKLAHPVIFSTTFPLVIHAIERTKKEKVVCHN